ncbi:putative Ig domain-containing protein [Rhizobium sp. P28RR-XV]|uniref:putative Ig domain-containing protein n=1 Tax=Rhizobium sp. P28RR-XV TaxID=2726737 RepID=UPI00145739C9|nr:putative Ig domain-containing protein [Rhizobium sp. P28RR-XV]NLR88304.1 autotransporter domain-containing protein [Rhizobium sp. P28RR-XV]
MSAATSSAQSAPFVTSVSAPANGYYRGGDSLIFGVQFSENVILSGAPNITLAVGSTLRQANYLAGGGTNSLLFAYVVQPGDVDLDGVSLGAVNLNGGTIQNAGGAAADTTLNNVASTAGVLVDTLAPTAVTAVIGTPPSDATQVAFQIVFSKAVTGFSIADIVLTRTGTVTATLSNLSTADNTTYTVVAQDISGTGTLRVDIAGGAVIDAAGNTNMAATGSPWMAGAGVPGAPTIGMATAGNGQAAVAFTPPASNGGAEITGYTVTSSPGGFTANGSSSPITVMGLTNGMSYTFTVTATNSVGTGSASAASSSVIPATVPEAPTIGSATAGNGQALVAFSAPSSNGGAAITSYTVTSSPGGFSGTGSASPIVVAGLANGTSYTFTVAAANSIGTGSPSAASNSITPVASLQVPIAGDVSASVAANSSANPVTLSLSGGAAASVAVATGPAHGTATASGTAIIYTPTSDYSGSDSFTYTATNATGTSAPATVNVTISAPTLTLSPPSGALPAGVVNIAYSQAVTVSGGTSAYGYSVSGTLPAGLSLNHATGVITGTPTTAGSYSFSISAADANNATSSAAYTIVIAFTFSPSGGALPQAMAGEAYSQQITATGGVGPTIYSLASGALPNGLVLNISTGQLTGPLAAGAQGDYGFSIQARDSNGSTGTAAYTLKVGAQAVTVADQTIDVPEGSTPPDVYLNRGATGGPFTSGVLAFVEPANAGTAAIIQGQLAQAGPATSPVGWYLHYTLNPAYSGQIRVGYKLVSALGTSNTATVTYNVSYDAGKVAEDIDNLVHDFVRSRQNMIANTIEVPGLLQRRQMETATDPITARMMPSQEGMTLGFSTSLSQMRAAGGDADAASAPFNVWVGGAFLAHDDKNKNDSTSKWGSFAMINMGADYLISERALIGLSLHYDRMTDPTDEDAELTGNGWLAGPYASLEVGKGVFWNGSLRYGGSSNTIDTQFWDGNFTTTRWMADTSIEGQWNLDEDTTISPKLRAIYFSEKVDDYTVKNNSGDAITIDGFNEDQFRVSLGAEIARSFVLENDTKLTPKLGLTGGFSGLDGAGAFGAVTAGLQLQTTNFWMLNTSLLFNIEGDGQKSVGAKVAAAKKF